MLSLKNSILLGIGVILINAFTIVHIQNKSLRAEVSDQQKQIAVISTQRDFLIANNDELVKALDVQSKAINGMEDVQKRIDAMIRDFQSTTDKANRNILDIKKRVSQESPPNTCEDAILYLRNTGKEVQ